MTALIVSPDYASHYFPLSAVGAALAERGHEVVVATGSGLRDRVRDDGFEHAQLALGHGRNRGLAGVGEDPSLRAFLEATKEGAVATLRYQAEQRQRDLLWEPDHVADRLTDLIAEIRPRFVVSDQLAYGASLALRAIGQPYAAFLPGHPSQLPPPTEPFGYPARLPAEIAAAPSQLERLRELCEEAAADFTATFNRTLQRLAPEAPPVAGVFAAGSPWLTLVNYPAELVGTRRFPHRTALVGSCVRRQAGNPQLDSLDLGGRPPRAYVALGSFLSGREDVLARVVGGLRATGLDAVVATGVADPEALGPIPRSWLVRRYLPQVAALRACDVVVCHGGNNTVTEALTAGLPVVSLPFSTDQFAGAADLDAAGLGATVDPNRADSDAVRQALEKVLDADVREKAAAIGERLRSRPGARRAAVLVERCLAGAGARSRTRHVAQPSARPLATADRSS